MCDNRDKQLEKELFYLLEGIVEDAVTAFEEEHECTVNNVDVKLTKEYVRCYDMNVVKEES